jgi:hypothetical protein
MTTVRLALFLRLIEIRLLFNSSAAVLGDLLIGLSGAIQVGGANFRPASLDKMV